MWEWWQCSYEDESSAAVLHSPPLGDSPCIESMEFRLPGEESDSKRLRIAKFPSTLSPITSAGARVGCEAERSSTVSSWTCVR